MRVHSTGRAVVVSYRVKTILSHTTVERETVTNNTVKNHRTPEDEHSPGQLAAKHASNIAITAFMVRCDTPSSRPRDIG